VAQGTIPRWPVHMAVNQLFWWPMGRPVTSSSRDFPGDPGSSEQVRPVWLFLGNPVFSVSLEPIDWGQGSDDTHSPPTWNLPRVSSFYLENVNCPASCTHMAK
jgi:hypothetical protein